MTRAPEDKHLYSSMRFGDALLEEIGRAIPLRGTLLDLHRWVYPRVKGKLPHLIYVGQRA